MSGLEALLVVSIAFLGGIIGVLMVIAGALGRIEANLENISRILTINQ